LHYENKENWYLVCVSGCKLKSDVWDHFEIETWEVGNICPVGPALKKIESLIKKDKAKK
jgi:hypothetical protein